MAMLFAICQNGMLDTTYNLVDRLALTIRNLIERHMTDQAWRAETQRTAQVVFGNVVDMGDRMNGHPGMNSAHIFRFDSAILLLETSYRLNGVESSKGENPQHEQQHQAEQAQPGAFTRRVQFLSSLSSAIANHPHGGLQSRKGRKKGSRAGG
jgi:hypothetical protein